MLTEFTHSHSYFIFDGELTGYHSMWGRGWDVYSEWRKSIKESEFEEIFYFLFLIEEAWSLSAEVWTEVGTVGACSA